MINIAIRQQNLLGKLKYFESIVKNMSCKIFHGWYHGWLGGHRDLQVNRQQLS